MAQGDWYYCMLHHRVEPWDACKAEDRLGPYPTASAAGHALETVKQRDEEWIEQDQARREDPRFNDPDDPDKADWEGLTAAERAELPDAQGLYPRDKADPEEAPETQQGCE